jgi:hypothetical protein
VVASAVYYGGVCWGLSARAQAALACQAVVFTFATSFLTLFLEEFVFKFLFFVAFIVFHGLYLFHVRYAITHISDDVGKNMKDSVSVAGQVNVFLLAACFFALIFYFNIGYAFYAGIVFFPLAGMVVWSCTWAEGWSYPEQLLKTAVLLLVIAETVLALLWLPVAYSVAAFLTAAVFFILYDFLIRIRSDDPARKRITVISWLAIGIMVVYSMVFAQWR